MIVEELVEGTRGRAEGAQAIMQEVESTSVSFENDRLKSVKSAQSTSITVRVVVDGRLGISRTTDISDRDGVVNRALEAAAFGSPVHFSIPPPRETPQPGGDGRPR